jgi:hypothetical protein
MERMVRGNSLEVPLVLRGGTGLRTRLATTARGTLAEQS